ncbi:MAG: hypothetical protein ABSD89_15775 [Halobacteriota archaeon]|jgi:hypothetical protein
MNTLNSLSNKSGAKQHGLDGIGGVIKLQFAVSTGAVAFFVHAMFERAEGPLLVGILSMAAICFGAAALMCINALSGLMLVRVGLAAVIGASDKKNPKEKLEERFTELTKRVKIVVAFLYAGVIFSVALLVAKFVMEIAVKFSHR